MSHESNHKAFFPFILTAILISACQKTYNCPAPMTPEKQEELDFDPDSWWSEDNPLAKVRYYGTYNGYDILLSEGMTNGFMTISVAESYFNYHCGFELYAHKDGTRIPLKEAYEQGLVSKETIEKVAELHQQCYEKLFPDEE